MAAGGGDVRWRFDVCGIVSVPRLGRAAAVVAKIGTEVPERPVGTARGQRGGTPRSERWRMAVVLGRLFEALGLSRYAALCTSPVTAAVMRTFDERGVSAGREAYQRALHRCGIVPPDVAELTWGTVMGVEE